MIVVLTKFEGNVKSEAGRPVPAPEDISQAVYDMISAASSQRKEAGVGKQIFEELGLSG